MQAMASDVVPYYVCEGPGYSVGLPAGGVGVVSVSVQENGTGRWLDGGWTVQSIRDESEEAWQHFASGKGDCRVEWVERRLAIAAEESPS